MNNEQSLDAYETALLAALRGHVAERAAANTNEPKRRRAAAIAASVAAVGAAFGTFVMWPQAAYAVDTGSEGDIHVTIRSLTDTKGLEEALAEAGVDAKVTYDPDAPTPPAGAPGGPNGNGEKSGSAEQPETNEVREPSTEDLSDDDSCRLAVAVRQESDQVEFTLSANAAEADATLYINAAGGTEDDWTAMAVTWSEPPC